MWTSAKTGTRLAAFALAMSVIVLALSSTWLSAVLVVSTGVWFTLSIVKLRRRWCRPVAATD